MPDVGEGLTEAEVVTWHVAPGDTVVVNQIIVEIETAKAAVELPSPFAGTVGELLVEPGQTVDVGAPILSIDTAEAGPGPGSAEPTGAKIGETGADGRVANLVGYGARPGSVTRRRRRPRAAAPRPGRAPRRRRRPGAAPPGLPAGGAETGRPAAPPPPPPTPPTPPTPT